MKLGAYTACLHDRSLQETLKILGEFGLTSAEINAGGFIPAPHLPIQQIRASAAAREDYLGQFEGSRDAGKAARFADAHGLAHSFQRG